MAPLLTVKQVAALLGVSVATVYDLVARGKLTCFRVGRGRGAIRCSEAQIQAYLESTAEKSVGEVNKPAPRPKPQPRRHLTLD